MHRIAQIGAGRMGSVHLRNAAANPSLDLAFVVDPRPDVAEVAAGVGARPARLEDVLADPSVEGVIVASSTDAHLDHALAALDAGKAVFCEKPLDLDARRLRAFEGVLAKPAAPLFVAFNRRFDPHFRALKARLDGGEIGDLETLQIVNHDPAAPPAHFLPTSGGLFKDFTIHDFDMAGWLMPDAPSEIFAWASCLVDPAIAAVGDVDTARVMLKDARGRLCVISNTRRSGCGYDQRIEAFGSRGMAVAGDLVQDTVQVWQDDGARGAALHPGFMARYAEAYAAEMAHFAAILASQATPETGYEASLRSLELAEAAAESAKTGAPVRL
ncbi:MAG: Gfo/Idh/MocA family oxidoreductase [Phenylobacterium sp.]|uniref:Gfo/Idh/MocA family protein n=1 Tax=Phenylobacterium sp. TaxID=1871053 RepID=UPI001A4E5E60|nr:Gfo/Idh/MocA family oxidoreductase [Phenylobacterium sp.]MBL8555444.1 Gfo/Idh/MocA family oxidoreductase [Phenylobacterium sp.]